MKKKACSVCFGKCVTQHGNEDEDADAEITPAGSSGHVPNENVASEPLPSFLKKMTDLTITSAMQMPASFVKTSFKRIGTTVTLEGPGKDKWRVKIGPGTLQKCTLEFRDGWQKFAADHILQIGDQLSFTLTADSHFQVLVYDESGSQKASATDATNSPPTLQQSKEKKAQFGAFVQFQSKGRAARPKLKVKRRLRTAYTVPSEKPAILELHSSESELRNSDPSEKKNNLKDTASEEKSPDQLDTNGSHLPLLPPHVLLDGHVISQRRPVTQAEKERTLKAANALPLTNPKLVVSMSKAYVYRGFWMSLSRPFSKAHMPHETREVTLRNRAGHKWPVKWLYKANHSSGFSGGWRGFALDHRLEESDVCVFEIVDAKNFVILVHIFRSSGDPTEDVRNYRPTPGKSRNAGWNYKRNITTGSFHHSPGPNPTKKCLYPEDHKSPAGCSKVANSDYIPKCQIPEKLQMTSCAKRSPKDAANVCHGVCCKGIVSDKALQCELNHKVKKAKSSPTTSCEVYAEYASFVAPPNSELENVGLGADFQIGTLHPKQSTANKVECIRDGIRDDLLKLGRELVGHQAAKTASPNSSPHSDGNEQMQIVSPPCQDQLDLSLPKTSEPPPFQSVCL